MDVRGLCASLSIWEYLRSVLVRDLDAKATGLSLPSAITCDNTAPIPVGEASHAILTGSVVSYCNVLPCPTVSDHDAPYVCINIRACRFQPRFKLLRDEKQFDEKAFIGDIASLPFNIVYGIDDPDQQLDIFNSLIKDCLDRHAPLRRSKITRPPAPWLNHSDVKQLQKERNELRYLAHKTNLSHVWNKFRVVRNTIQTNIKKVKTAFYQKALSSKKTKELWKVIHRTLHPNPKPINADPDQLNSHFSSTSQRLLGSVPTSPSALQELVNSLPVCMSNSFNICPVAHSEVLNQLRTIRSDCSTGIDQIPVKYLKMAADYIASPLTYIINGFIATHSFPDVWKTACVSPIPKVASPTELDHYRPISILPALTKVYERLILNQIVKYIDQHNVLNENVTGFRKGHATSSVL
ncbi:Hypothetical predicted protein [Paramuricea clavata]|uniref:Uncharacterized protein n=1 Tax=Paramuricea clavata TaxID=317549 RepID=A0A6S7G9X8_PARCT|nr:Hypothetical predicted protein [Paramuricea clavata]